MSKNKIIFSIIGGVVLLLLIFLFFFLSNKSNKSTGNNGQSNAFVIWLLYDNSDSMVKVVKNFQSKNSKYGNKKVQVVSFSNYEEYFSSLMGAFVRGNAPNLFMIHNTDGKFFENETIGIDNATVNIDSFRKNYDEVFSNDLIRKTKIDDTEVEFLAGLPIGYEPPMMYYNFRELKGKNLNTWAYVDQAIKELREENQETTLGMGNGSTVYRVSDILNQFFVQNELKSIEDVGGSNLKSSFETYFSYGDINKDNQYNTFKDQLTQDQETNIDLFAKGKVQIVMGYPRMLEEINKRSISKNFVRGAPFPTQTQKGDKYGISYSYLAINKNAKDENFAFDFISYLNQPSVQKDYLSKIPYYLPAQLSLLSERLNENVKSGYNVKYSSFYNPDAELISFDTRYQMLYDEQLVPILDTPESYGKAFDSFKRKILCLNKKMAEGTNLETPCEK